MIQWNEELTYLILINLLQCKSQYSFNSNQEFSENKYQYCVTMNCRPSRKSGITPKTTKVRVNSYVIIQSPHWFSELTHSSSEASISILRKTQTQETLRI